MIDLDDRAATDLAMERHPLNVLISEYDWRRAQEVVNLDGCGSVSDVVRAALASYLDKHPDADRIRELVTMTLEFEVKARATRESVLLERQSRRN